MENNQTPVNSTNNNDNNTNSLEAQIQALQAQLTKERLNSAKADKRAKLLEAKFSEVYTKTKGLTKEQLDEMYDPADPTSVQKAIDEHTKKLNEELASTLKSIDDLTETYIKNEFSQKELTLADKLAVFNQQNNTNLTADQLENDIPPRILKQYKDDEAKLFEEASKYLSASNTNKSDDPYNPTPPYNPQGTPNLPDSASSEVVDGEGDEGDDMY